MGLKKAEGPQLEETGELEQFPSKQLWLQAFGFESFNRVYFSLRLLVLYQHMRWLPQHPHDPGTCSANGSHSATSHSWTASFSMEFSAIKRPRCSRMILLVLKRCQVLAKNWQEGGCLRVGSLETNSGMEICSQEVYIREGSWEACP